MNDVLGRLRREALARAAFVVDDDGVVLAADSDAETPLERLGEMAIEQLGGVAGLARQITTSDFGLLFHDVTGEDVYVVALDDGWTLGILFDQNKTSVGAVRLHVMAFRAELMREKRNS